MITRFGSFNVLRLQTPDRMNSVLTENAIDICGMQEVSGLKKLRAVFDQNIWECLFDGGYHSYGTGLIFRKDKFDLVSTSTHVLKPAPGKKTAFEVVLALKETNQIYHIFVTHLDHKTEPQRIREWVALQKVLPSDKPHIILGDLNSLRRSDYTDDAWKEIADSRRRSDWEEPKTELIEKILSSNYADVLSDCRAVAPTCRFDTRVDYIFTYGFAPAIRSFVLDSQKTSDHKIIVTDLQEGA